MIRLNQNVEVILGLLDNDGNTIGTERTITDLFAENGVSVLSHRKIPIGEKVHFETVDRQFETLAKVKNIHTTNDNKFRLMLEFIGESWNKQFNYWTQFINNELLDDSQDEFVETAKEVSLLLQIVISDANNGEPLDQV